MEVTLSASITKQKQDYADCFTDTVRRIGKPGGRVLRSRRQRKQSEQFFEEQRPPKRLFTPEIKRYLKAWLVRRRDNPYPSREEKKDLADQTGLTYIQICNWFANWRRKLKNTGKEFDSSSWGTLIKTYNGQVEGNVEQFSISSDDSIWQEVQAPIVANKNYLSSKPLDHSYTNEQCFQISSTTDFTCDKTDSTKATDKNGNYSKKKDSTEEGSAPLLLRRWLQSAACFQPRQGSYIPQKNVRLKTCKLYEDILSSMHGREELDAAEALTFLARAARSKLSI